MEAQPKIAVVILNYNGVYWLERFLDQVIKNSPEAEVIVADNASSDNSISFLKEHFPKIRLIQNENNDGYAGGYNKALSQVNADYFVLLNTDVEVSSNWIMPVIDLMDKDPKIAACQPKIKQYHNKAFFEYAGACGGFLDKFGFPYCRGRIFETLEEDKGQYDNVMEVFWATGACLFIRTSSFFEIGGFDDEFFAHMEEIDLCWRLQKSGYKIMCQPKSVVYHVGGGTLNSSSSFKTYLNYRNNLYMLYKNLEKNRFSIIFRRMALDGLSSIKFLMDGKPKHILAILRAHISFYAKISTLKRKRSKLKKSNLDDFSIIYKYFVRKKKTYSDLTK